MSILLKQVKNVKETGNFYSFRYPGNGQNFPNIYIAS